ncbi:TetR/AcrR family transcriptional regulator [Kutzneria buriramensis]|uniref:Regulatory TetR family protein n=1 Tax=Kutzneria buriramensis TaxID=1045776 RepID=A0A3E0I0V3_9PSEU|nr:TetR/AcrR family transcriptional regulator [Kutzneria buriramensis]REH52251.1 regulatory TetR family protein [Kutzneria buriramensis]
MPQDFTLVWTRLAEQRRRQALSVEQIVAVAIRLADAEGTQALTMRRVATEAGTGTTSLYRYVTNKDELLELMVDAVQGEREWPTPSGDWRADLTVVADGMRATMLRHPWLATELRSRPTLGPNALRQADFALAAAGGATDDITLASALLGTVANYVHGAVLAELSEREDVRSTGMTQDEWRSAVSPYVREVIIDSGNYPRVARRIFEADDLSHDQQFAFGLECVLAGIEKSVAR